MKLAVIPARGGSKRIPHKNIKPFCGKPIIAWSIEAALSSDCFERVIVSTDNPEIAAVARSFGAEVPFLRPASLSDDYTGTTAVVAHAIDWFSERGAELGQVCCIYATAPFVTANDLRRGEALITDSGCDYAFSVTSYPFPVQRAIRITENGRVEMFDPNHFNTRSQDLEEAFHDAGQFYWGQVEAWRNNRMIFSSQSLPVVLSPHRVQDIDTEEDWIRAEWLFKAMRHRSES